MASRPLPLNLFVVSLPLIAIVAVAGIIAPKSLAGAATAFTTASFAQLDWVFMLGTSAMLLLALWLAFSRFGSLRLGQPDDKPEFSNLSWFAMLFAAGMGTGIMFWGVAEPLTHFRGAPGLEAGTADGADQAMVITAMHWGVHAWAIYAISGLVLAYFCFRRGGRYLPGEPIRSMFHGRWVEPVATFTDLLAILAIVFGVAAAMTMGTFQVQTGLSIIFDIDASSNLVAGAILVVLVAAYMTSAATSLDKGIRILSNLNVAIAVVLGLFLWAVGPSYHVLKSYIVGLGDYAYQLPKLSIEILSDDADKEWIRGWTITYFAWWIAWAPFVGVFIARISRGRTIREFVLGVIFVPTLFSLLWFSILGGAGIYGELGGTTAITDAMSDGGEAAALFAFFGTFPMAKVLSLVAVLLVFIFLVTSADSATFVLGMLTSEGSMDPPRHRKMAWGIALGILGGALTLTRNVEVVKSIAIVGAIPFTFAMFLQIAAFLRALYVDEKSGQHRDGPQMSQASLIGKSSTSEPVD